MIVSKTPYRLPLSGGGTDIDFFYKKFGSRFLSASVSEYVYVILLERKLDQNYMIQTSAVEFSKKVSGIKHNLIRETIKYFDIREKLQISTVSTIPTSTGLGSSSAMVVGLIKCISKFKSLNLTNKEIFKIAYKIERKICGFAGGWQDQIMSTYGGFLDVIISKKENFKIKKLQEKKIIKIVNKHFILVYSDVKRDSSDIIYSQKKNLKNTFAYYKKIKSYNKSILKHFFNYDIKKIGIFLTNHWLLKKKLTKNMTGVKIDQIFGKVQKIDGFLGAKLIGAGGGGFFLVNVSEKKKAIKSLNREKLSYIDLKFERNGSKLINLKN